MKTKILEYIADADMVLVGLGEELNGKKFLKASPDYQEKAEMLEKQAGWLLPAYQDMCLAGYQDEIKTALQKLVELLQDKNYYVLSTSTNPVIRQLPWKHDFLVMPCGSSTHKQCINGCEGVLEPVSEVDKNTLEAYLKEETLSKERFKEKKPLSVCPACGGPMVLNNYYLEKYNENGYLDKWQIYTKWLQGTLNKKLLILELGAEFDCPSVMRWPFEKVAFYNQKAKMIRVNERLYQLTEELKEKGLAIPQNAIEWLQML